MTGPTDPEARAAWKAVMHGEHYGSNRPIAPGPDMRVSGSKRTLAYPGEHLFVGEHRPLYTYRGVRRAGVREINRLGKKRRTRMTTLRLVLESLSIEGHMEDYVWPRGDGHQIHYGRARRWAGKTLLI
jgi:hypothetical protein